MEVQEEGGKLQGNAIYTLLVAVKQAFRRYKSQLEYVKKNNFWKKKPYLWGRTHISILKHVIYWNIIKR
jgi:hypothetical protein